MSKPSYKSNYSEKLKDPRWQKKRLEVMEANEFHCEICGDGESTLHVHHKEYFKGREVWEYENAQLAVICEGCHDFTHSHPDLLKLVCSYAPLDGPCNRDELAFILAAHMGIEIDKVLSWGGLDPSPGLVMAYESGEKIKETQGDLMKEFWISFEADRNK